MPAQYAPLPNPHTDPDAQNEMEAAFLESDDEDDERPMTQPTRNGYHSLAHEEPSESSATHLGSGTATYNFENVDYDADSDWARPPPGSPPPDANSFHAQGNSNGLIPDLTAAAANAQRRTGSWLRETAGRVLPSQYAERLGLNRSRAAGAVGGGTDNDGVFANVTAKPSTGIRVQDGV